jgi:DNA-binding NarL/FixJ family response regulator
VLGKTLLVRQPIAQSLAVLDFQVIDATGPAELAAPVDLRSAAIIVMDADGMAKEWRALAGSLHASRGAAALVLVTSRFSFDDVHEAMALGVAGVIVKPFRKEEHMARILDLALRQMNVKARRSEPRFTIPDSTRALLTWSEQGSGERLEVRNIAAGGASLTMEAAEVGAAFTPGGFIPLAVLSWGDVTLEVNLDVIHRDDDSAGVRFARIYDGEHKLHRALEERRLRALGLHGRKRKW